MPALYPKADPTPAVERTPGPGVIIRKKSQQENLANVQIVLTEATEESLIGTYDLAVFAI